MNLFVVGRATDGRFNPELAGRSLAALISRLPFFESAQPHTWVAPSHRAAMACVSHPQAVVGDVRYFRFEPTRAALFTGRPIRLGADGTWDGRGPLDPAFYLRSSAQTWAPELDGRWAAARYDDEEGVLEVVADHLGAYPLYVHRGRTATWYSNAPEALRSITGTTATDPLALASIVGAGWSLRGDPLWSGVSRLGRGRIERCGDGAPATRSLLPTQDIARLAGQELDADEAARMLVSVVRVAADWPGRPALVPVTGGRDSRLVLAAALRAGVAEQTLTGGAPDAPDVVLGKRLAEAAGVTHQMLDADPRGDVFSDWRAMARVLMALSAGTASLADAAGYPLSPRPGPLPLWQSGQGGEIARSYYGPGSNSAQRVASHLYDRLLGRRPGRMELLNGLGERLIREEIVGFVDEVVGAGARTEDAPDLFYLLRRMSNWSGPSHGCVEPIRDTMSPLWSRHLLGHELALTARRRELETFHLSIMRALAPELVDLPFQGGPWPQSRSALGRRAARAAQLAAKARAEIRRRAVARTSSPAPAAGSPVPTPPSGFERTQAEVREVVLSDRAHPAWELLDPARVERVLTTPEAALDVMGRYYVWRLATVFGAWPRPGPLARR